MKLKKLLGVLLIVALLAWAIETGYLFLQNANIPKRIGSQGSQSRYQLEINYKRKIRELEHEYEKKKHLATGETVFDRIFNTQGQSISDLIRHIAEEALPNGWSCEVKVEEFTHFILNIYLPHNKQQASPDQVVSYLDPVIKYCNWYLSNVAVFDRTHKSYLFFDKVILDEIDKNKKISLSLATRAEGQGAAFTRFNSTTIKCEKQESHLFLPIEVIGKSGIVTCYALFDTGASMTTLSGEAISKTGYDNLQTARRRSFSTANGWMSCPIVSREVNVGGFRKSIEVAVNQQDELNLLGMNFFEGMDYIVDFQNCAIYVWEK